MLPPASDYRTNAMNQQSIPTQSRRTTRRHFLIGSTAAMLAGATIHRKCLANQKPASPNGRLGVGSIGLRYQGSVDTHKAAMFGEIVAVCDVDAHVRDQAKASFGSTPRAFDDYQDLLARPEVDVVIIGTPDHWHTKMAADAMRAGKHVYVEKPLTLSVDEGKLLRRVAAETGKVVQVGSWQRSDSRFRLAVEMVHAGRIGKLQQVDVVLGKNQTGGPFASRAAPKHLDWNRWQGQTPDVPYVPERCHYTFRWWHEYSGGQMTDWGAHHLDIAQWAIGLNPIEVAARAKYPAVQNGYNVPIDFSATYRYADGVTMTVADTGRNGIMFTGDQGRMFVNRGTIAGAPVEQLAGDPLPREDFQLYGFDNLDRPQRAGKLEAIVNHMGNFFDCIAAGKQPVSDLESQHRSVTTCHLGNIAMRLGRKLAWDAEAEAFVDDAEADALLSRPQRSGFEVS